MDVATEGALDDLPDEHRTCIYRVVQEAVNNASRHSRASQIRIYVQQTQLSQAAPPRLRVSIQDDGKGFEPLSESGIGILGMEERIARLGGALSVDSEPGRGTIVSFGLPLPEAVEAAQATSPLRTAYKISSGRL